MRNRISSAQPTLFQDQNFRITFALRHLNFIRDTVRTLTPAERDVVLRAEEMRSHIQDLSREDYNALQEIYQKHQPAARQSFKRMSKQMPEKFSVEM
ncbi:MAG: hypothetical protein EPO24_15880 [Bacteroidetes bacterium]|nr:MAG: hypothetical protein EPO24_15880 [Bacteroidota bacterium]